MRYFQTGNLPQAFERSLSITPKPIPITKPLKKQLKKDFQRLGAEGLSKRLAAGKGISDDLIREFADPRLPELLLNRGTKELLELPPEGAVKFINSTRGAEVFAMPREIADHLNTFRSTFLNEESTKQFLKGYDNVLNLWKGYATAANFGFHGRNAISNYWLGFLRHGASIFDPISNNKAMAILMSQGDGIAKKFPLLREVLDGTINTPKGPLTYRQVFKLAKQNGIINKGWLGADIPRLVDRQLTLGLANSLKRTLTAMNPASQDNILLRLGRDMGVNVENHARMLQFVKGLQKGESALESAIQTKKFLFDYADLTKFEQNVMKRIVPFYTWMRKNIPLQFEQLLKQPSKYTTLIKAKGEIEREINVPKHMPDFVRSGFPIFASEDIKGRPEAFLLRNFIPAADIEQVIGRGAEIAPGTKVPEIVRTIISSTTPLIKSPLEQALNLNLFFGRPIERFPGETEEILGIPVTRRIAKELPRPFGEVTRLIGKRRQEVGLEQPTLPPRILRFLTGLKGFPVQERKARKFSKFKREQLERGIRASLTRAKRRGDTANVRAATKALRELQRQR